MEQDTIIKTEYGEFTTHFFVERTRNYNDQVTQERFRCELRPVGWRDDVPTRINGKDYRIVYLNFVWRQVARDYRVVWTWYYDGDLVSPTLSESAHSKLYAPLLEAINGFGAEAFHIAMLQGIENEIDSFSHKIDDLNRELTRYSNLKMEAEREYHAVRDGRIAVEIPR